MSVRELHIQLPDSQIRTIQLTGDHLSLGRSSSAELCFPDDAGLSRHHLMLEREGENWIVQDLGSKNGTLVNDIPLKGRLILQPGDRIAAGHLNLTYDALATPEPDKGVVFFDGGERESPGSSTLMNLEGAISNQTLVAPAGPRGSTQVQALIRAGQLLAANHPITALFGDILDLAAEAVGAQRGVVMVFEGEELVVKANRGEGFDISSAVRDHVLKGRESVLVRDAQMDDALKGRLSIVEQKVRTLMAVPLQTADRTLGLIYVDSPFSAREFTADDLSLLTVMANTAAIRIEHARLAEVEEAERRLARELDQAAEIQRQFLPSIAPVVAGVELAGYNAPSRAVGGDYYDFFPYPDGRVALALGDVSGKGLPAALMMMGLEARVEVLAAEPGDLTSLMNRLNKATLAHFPSNKFITFFFCVLNPATGEIDFSNAGHNPPFLVRADSTVEMIEGGGPPLGIMPHASYPPGKVRLNPGDVLVIYSDGVTDAVNPHEEDFGEERFAAVLQQYRDRPPSAIIDAVNQAIAEWASGAPAADDATLLVARRPAIP